MQNKNKMRIAILEALKSEIISGGELLKRTKAKRHEKEFVREINGLYSNNVIIPIYQDGSIYFMQK